VKSEPRPGIHSAHLKREVSTVTERTPRVVHRTQTCRTVDRTAAIRFNRGKFRVLNRLTPAREGVYARCTSGSATGLPHVGVPER
jgi:hypothetical protein